MAWNRDRRNRYVSKFEGLASDEHDILARLGLICIWVRIRRRIWSIDQIPVGGSRCDLRPIMILKILRAPEMIGMTMAKQDVFHFARIQSELLHSCNDLG